jgi:hypothetical protein
MNKPEVLLPDPKIMAQVDEILRQNAIILDVNKKLLEMLMHPIVYLEPERKESR